MAIANSRILSVDERSVTFLFKDYRDSNRQKVMTLDAVEFLRRFLLHVLPDGLRRIRHFGLLANRSKKPSLALCRRLLPPPCPTPLDPPSQSTSDAASSSRLCPACKTGRLVRSQLPAQFPARLTLTPCPPFSQPARASPAPALLA